MDFLLEIGCEEIPARFLPPALEQIERLFLDSATAARLAPAEGKLEVTTGATPRRLVLWARGLAKRQPDVEEEICGPKVEAAYGQDGQPTKACIGFARSRGVDPERLVRIQTDRGEVVGLRRKIEGKPTAEVLGPLTESLLGGLVFPKTMRWGEGEHSFARPVHWILALLDDEVLDLTFAGARSGRTSRGHRLSHPAPFEVTRSDDFFAELGRRDVILSPAERRRVLLEQARALAREQGGRLVEDAGLEEEITFLTERPVPQLGSFDEGFLELPRSVLIAAMRNHQRYFAIEDETGRLKPAFVAVSNSPGADASLVRYGNERVLTARLSDARFFFVEDQRRPPTVLLPALQDMVFQSALGSYYEKSVRVANLALFLSHALGLGAVAKMDRVIEAVAVKHDKIDDPRERFSWQVARAAVLSKTDLLTQIVGEFPELQGEMGGEYLRLAGEEPEVALAVREHYRPRQAHDALPKTDIGVILALADRLDTLAGCFGVGLRPTGGADPYALRRQCLGVISIVLDRGLRISLRRMLEAAVQGVRDKVEAALLLKAKEKAKKAAQRKGQGKNPPEVSSVEPFEEALVQDLFTFFEGRLRMRLQESARADVVEAVIQAGIDDLAEARLRADALQAFTAQPAFDDLAVAFKRVVNILGGAECGGVRPELLTVPEERSLYDVFLGVWPRFTDLVDVRRFDEAMGLLGQELRVPVDRFFGAVLVNDPNDPARQANRKALLGSIAKLFGRIADFSRIATREN